MNANRKANLQRKLTLAPLPKPPAGLAERIKSEIPKHLRFDAERERERLSHSVAFNIRVAASILILISLAYLALQVMSRVDQEKPAAVQAIRRPLPVVQPITQPVAKTAEPQMAEARPAPPKLTRHRQAKKQEVPSADVGVASPSAPPAAAVAEAAPVPAREEAKVRTAAFARMERGIEPEMTTSPISGKVMVWTPSEGQIDGARRLDQSNVYELEPNAATIHLDDRRLKLIAWKDASPQAKAAILSAELARGGDRQAIARAAREAGLNELADSIEKH